MMWSQQEERELGRDDVTNCWTNQCGLGVVKWDVGGHGSGQAVGERCYLMVDVGEEGVRAPAAEDLDGLGVIAIEM